MSHAAESATESVQSVAFSFLTDEEVRKHSFMKITNPILLNVMGKPVPGGLYDPALGPMDENTPCQSCGQVSRHCPGHCGHIDLVSPVYNPLLFDILYNILKRACFFCCHFRANRKELETCTSQLKLIMEGDIIGAKKLGSNDPGESTDPEDHDQIQYQNPKLQKKWTSIQLSEALSILNKLLKAKNSKDESVRITGSVKCQNCGKRNPKITKPTFGWLHVSGMQSSSLRGNAVREQHRSNAEEGATDISPSENGSAVEATESNATKIDKEGKEVTAEYLQQRNFAGPLLPSEVRHTLKNLWENESELCSLITDIQSQGFGKKAGSSMFFLETVLVPPIRFRPPTKGGDSVMEHPQTALLAKVLQANIYLANAHDNNKAKVVNRWMDLQQSVNMVYDNKTASGQKEVFSGVIQLLEKKEGIFRQKMMGKRVNFACRSVISPDPYLAVNEIGIPPYFALRLTYPERVTPWNVVKLRDAVDSGPELHPGATHYADKAGIIRLHPRKKIRSATLRKLLSSRGVVMQNGKICDNEFEGKIVYRHLQDGDVVLVNRQPTLHKPSIMAHVVRVLKGEKTLRMHYANCSTYNADFDGDEINVHFPQDEISRAEAYNIVNANNQYVKPTSGEPIRSLIQDHVVSAALLTKRDTFLNSDQFNQLLYSSGVLNCSSNFSGKSDQKVFMSNFSSEILSLPPAIWKPEPLWTGKQVITALLYHITKGCPPFTMEKGAKIPHDFFKRQYGDNRRCTQGSTRLKVEADEDKLLIYKNELVRGVIDKAQFGDYGIIHSVQELYGSGVAGNLLSAFSRLFTTYLQLHGFTCGVEDLLLMQKNDNERKKHLEGCEIGEMVHRDFVHDMADGELDSSALQAYIERKICSNGENALTYLDRKMISSLNSKTSSVFFKELLSDGILKPSGRNCIALMTTSGAKGSMVNFQQISSHLGQQELEGKRVPRMVSGKTLPCFPPWDWSARAGGFITDRFLTGLHPQEYYFHCMAGREGLVDTAVKTSRSGYLQRCIIKNLESLRVGYDHTVRDADGSIIQFQYGEDGVDVHQTSYITKFEALAINEELVCNKLRRELSKSSPYISKLPNALVEKAKAFIHDFSLKRRIPALRQKNFMKLIEHKYLSSLAQPGEPVGVLAGQSVGEPSTQMTLNTFHLAGRGEMNVTLGIPRLQEVLMTASNEIKTPVMTCPLMEGRSMTDATRLADNMKKITVADIIESMKVSVEKEIKSQHVCSIYKLEMKLHKPKHYPKYADISLEDWEETLEVVYLRKLEDDIERHLTLLSKINGIKNFLDDSVSSSNKGVDADGDDVSTSGAQAGQTDDDDDDDGDDTEGAEDLGMDAQKRKKQGLDEFDYDDDAEEPMNEARKDDVADDEMETVEDGEMEIPDGKDVASESLSKGGKSAKKHSDGDKMKSERKGKKSRAKLNKKDSDKSIFVKAKKMHFEVHFKFINEPHILLSKIAIAAAQKVYIQSFGEVDQCKAITCKENQVIYYGENHRKRKELPASVKDKVPALQTTGVDFTTFWEMQDTLDVRYIYSNSVYAMLTTYGVEAARETIIREINNVFKSYGISVNIRHLTLIADYMTHTGGYRPLNRSGGISETISPFTKMSFETASKFIVEAACYGEVDTLETPSARICLGLPVKSGTGSLDLMQKVEI